MTTHSYPPDIEYGGQAYFGDGDYIPEPKPHLIFTSVEYAQNYDEAEKTIPTTIATYSLPLPMGMTVGNNIVYQQDGALGAETISAFRDVVSGRRDANDQGVVNNLATKLGLSVYTSLRDITIGGHRLGAIADDAERSFGVKVNPFEELFFNLPALRKFSFQYRFFPKSADESETLEKMLRAMKMAMYPKKQYAQGIVLRFPNQWSIEVRPEPAQKYYFKVKRSFLESMDYTFNAHGSPSFFAGTLAPTQVDISMTFAEAQIATSNDFDTENGGGLV